MSSKLTAIVFIILLWAQLFACTDKQHSPASHGQAPLATRTLDIAGHSLIAEIADSDLERRQGLAHRQTLAENHGMLFVYASSAIRHFTTRETYFALSIAFINEDGVIVDIQKMQARNREDYRSRKPAQYALEVNQGWFEERTISVGDKIALPRFDIQQQ